MDTEALRQMMEGMDPELLHQMMQMMTAGGGREGNASEPLTPENIRRDPFFRNVEQAMEAGPPPVYSGSLPSPLESRMAYIQAYKHFKSQEKPPDGQVGTLRQTMAPRMQHGVAPDPRGLRPTTLREVARKVNVIHDDRVLFLKTIYEPFTTVGTMVLVEDDRGDCLQLALYNFDEDLPRGTYLAFLSPYMKNAQDNRNASLMLRCDNPQCIVLFDSERAFRAAKEGRREPPVERVDPGELRKRGNVAFANKRYKEATRLYSRALGAEKIDSADKVACLGNRAEAALRECRWEDAEQDCLAVLSIEGGHVKAKFRLTKALVRLGKAVEANDIVRELVSASPKEKAFKELQMQIHQAVKEQGGIYDLELMRKEARLSGPMPFHADYISAKVELGVTIHLPRGGTYRGCRAASDIAEGELLTASKAFVFAEAKLDNVTLALDPSAKRLSKGSEVQLVQEAVKKLRNRPMLGGSFYNLTAGPVMKEIDPENLNKIDIPRIQSILSSNTFAVGEENEDLHLHFRHMKGELKEEELHTMFRGFGNGSGLWLTESLFNHSCCPNCSWTQIGDHMFVRSSRPIKVGDELCVGYTSVEDSFDQRKEKFTGWIADGIGFKCQCELCSTLRSDCTLRRLEKEVVGAYEEAACLVCKDHMPMGLAAEKVLRKSKRLQMISDFEQYPLRLQHSAGAHIHVMHGSWLKEIGDTRGAFKEYQKAADIMYQVRGRAGMGRAKDLWRLVGCAMALDQVDLAREFPTEIWQGPIFSSLSSPSEARETFIEFTAHYAMPWWIDPPDQCRECHVLVELVRNVIKESQKSKKKRRKKMASNNKL
jgi:tetratricopeptide (TPR) repeat protein